MSTSPVHNPQIYPRNWSENIVLPFLEKYSRGWKILAYLCRKEPDFIGNKLVEYSRYRYQGRFETLKRMIKILDSYEYRDFRHIKTEDRREYLTYVRYYANELYLDDMEKVFEDLT